MLKKFLRFVLPSMVAFAFTGLYSIVDGFFVGNNVGDDGLAAINVAYPLVAFINAVGTGIGMGGSVMLSIARGRGDKEGEKRYLGNTLIYLLAASAAVTALLVGTYPLLIDAFGAEGRVNAYADDYIFVLACFAAAQIFSTGCVPLLRNFGASFGAMFAMSAGFVTNIVLDWLFVDYLADGVYGAAVATGLGQIMTVLPCAVYLGFKIKKLGRGVFRPSLKDAAAITRVGLSPFGVLLCPQVITVILNKFLFVYGDSYYVAAYSVIMYVYCVDLLLLQGVGDGAQLCCDALTAAGIPARLAPPNLRQQTAWGVARQALELARAGQTVPPEALVPVYHRLSQAERERLAREKAAQHPTP